MEDLARDLRQLSAQSTSPASGYRSALKQAGQRLRDRFQADGDAVRAVRQRAANVDLLLKQVWEDFFPSAEMAAGHGPALVAVGGYGRAELHPGSDVDLMILLPDGCPHELTERLRDFLAMLWDVGLEIGHSVRTVAECVHEAGEDITVATNLMEARLLAGQAELYTAMREATGPDRLWPSRDFFAAKWREQKQRHHKFNDTEYNLEPNIKEGPGGLRDIQMIGWVAKRHFDAPTLHALVAHGFLSENEYASLNRHQELLWRIRCALHFHNGRREDRLLFDQQHALAGQFGYRDSESQLAVEQFMKAYYRAVGELGRLNEMLLQLFQEAILYADEPGEPVAINKRFQARKGFIEASNENVFARYPFALLEIFLLLEQHTELKGVRAQTIRLIRANLHRIDDSFRADLACRSLFMEIIRQPRGLTHVLRRMHRYGVLAAYLPAFGNIVGQMQYDLFHVYTVDEHSLMVIRNLRRVAEPEFADELPHCSSVIKQIPKPEILYLAGLFHDIAKGRGGDHSELGAHDAETFCLEHGMSSHDAKLVAWLVRSHLIMSRTSQREDISDPPVITRFASTVGDLNRLNYLYLLTAADMRGTGPDVWNSWKGALLQELYKTSYRALRMNTDIAVEYDERIQDAQREAWTLLRGHGYSEEQIISLWKDLGEDYFLRYTVKEILWHTRAILESDHHALPLVLIREEAERGGTEIFIYAEVSNRLFADVTALLDQLGLTVVDARIISSHSDYTLDSYVILDESGETIHDGHRLQEIQQALREQILHPHVKATNIGRRIPRAHKHFKTPTSIHFSQDAHKQRTVMEVITDDRPGLLAHVGRALQECDVHLQNAKITTFGVRAEDLFYITDANEQALDAEACERLRGAVLTYLGS